MRGIEKKAGFSHYYMKLWQMCSIGMLIIALTGCQPGVATTQTTILATAMQPTVSLQNTETPTISSTATEQIYPAFTPGPTSTAIPMLQPGQPLILASISMMDEQNGWGIDTSEHIVHTTDGGQTWEDVTPYNGAYRPSGFFALDANTAWATPYQQACYTENCVPEPTNASVWHTSDAGKTWQEQRVCLESQECDFDFAVPPAYYAPIAIQFLDTQVGWLLISVDHLMFQDRYRLYKTIDGGAHWLPIMDSSSQDVPMAMRVTGLAFQDQQTGWMSISDVDAPIDPYADWGIYHSTDSGLTWSEIPLPVPDPLPESFADHTIWCGAEGVSLIPEDTLGVTIACRVYTNPLSSDDFYFYSSDGGKHWTSWLKSGDVEFINPLVGWRLTFNNSAYDLEQTRDGGQTWAKIKTVTWNGNLEFVNERAGWAIATSNESVALVHTLDGGQTWGVIKPIVAAP